MGTSIRVRLPMGLKRDVEDIVQYLDQWSSPTEFIRDAIRRHRNRWVDEMRSAREQLNREDDKRLDASGV